MFDTYRNAFNQANSTIWWGDDNISRVWDSNTMCYYVAIVIFAMLIGRYVDNSAYSHFTKSVSAGKECYSYKVRRPVIIFFSVLALILGLRHYTVGIDTIVYRYTIEHATSLSKVFQDSTEPIYNILQYILCHVIGNADIGIFMYAAATLYFIYKGLSRYIGDISVYISLLSYVCIYFFPAMNLLRMSFAVSIIFANFHLFLEEKYKKFYLILSLTCMIHYSTAVMFIPLGVYHLYIKNKRLAIYGLGALALIIVNGSTMLGSYISLLKRYAFYIEGNVSSSGIGIMLFIDYLPALYLLFFLTKRRITGKWTDITICFTLSAFVIRLMAYYISAAGRLHAHFIFLSLILIPYWAWYMRINKLRNYNYFVVLCTIWALFRLHVYFTEYLSSDGIMPYHTIFYNF